MTKKIHPYFERITRMKKISYSMILAAVFFMFGIIFMNSCTKSGFYDESIGDPLKTDFAAVMPIQPGG